MKKAFASLLLLTALVSGCKKDALTSLADITFTQRYSEDFNLVPDSTILVPPSTPIPGGSAPLEFSYSFATGIKQLASDYNTSADKLVSVKVDSVSLMMLMPTGQNLDFLNNIEVRIGADGLSETSIARKKPVPKGLTTLLLDVDNVNLKDYFLKDSLRVRIVADMNATPALGTQLRFGNKFSITANPLK